MDLRKKPFYLTDDQVKQIDEIIASMTTDEKIGQLFIPIAHSTNEMYLKNQILKYHVGGVMFRPQPSEQAIAGHAFLQKTSRIPLLIGSNLESGGSGAATDGTFIGSQMEIAATGDPENAYRLGKTAASEGKRVGVNIAFAPIIDIDNNWRNPITNVRTYGKDPEVVKNFALKYKQGADEEGMAVSIKHFPGDGMDEVDQHILTSVNSLSMEEWDASYGKAYEALIGDGATAVMVGHVAMPAYQKEYHKDFEGILLDPEKQLVPASLSKELLQGLLRGKLGFNGLTLTDSTCMVGFSCAMDRETALPYAIESGIDMILFNKVLSEDFEYMKAGYEKGILSQARLDEALHRILAAKMSLKLFEDSLLDFAKPFKAMEEHRTWAREIADQSVTLVKDTQGNLPLSPAKTKKVLLQVMGGFPTDAHILSYMHEKLEKEGFEVEDYVKESVEHHDFSVETFKSKYDLVIYFANVENTSNKVTNRLNWYTFFGNGNNCPWFVKERPVVFVSLANPYHLVDVPMVRTYINAYANADAVLDAIVEKLMGRSDFIGVSPVDPFCGKDYLKF